MEDENISMTVEENQVTESPKLVFIVPYRDRQQQYEFFSRHMKMIMDGIPHRILYIHQRDNREFNRGALKNIGFLTVKDLYPDSYRDITLVLNDVDTMPYTSGFLDYHTVPGVVKHFYGFTFTLGGIVSINAGDFERINGFPNFWAWGYEDNMLNQRVNENGIRIDRSQFYKYLDKNVMQLHDGITRNVNKTEYDVYRANTTEGIDSLSNVQYVIDDSTGFVNVDAFTTGRDENQTARKTHDLRNGSVPFPHTTNRRRPRMGMFM